MAMVVKNNMSAVSTLNTLNKNSSALQKSLAKVSSGMKINSAQDDASGYAISEKMRVQIRSLDQANQNTQNASSMMKTAEGAVSSTVEILKSLKEKAINAATDTNTDSDRVTIQKELDQFIDQIDDNALTTFNGKYLVDGSKSHQGVSVATAMTNQSLATDTNGESKLVDLKNRNNESLEIKDTDYINASYVMDGYTYTYHARVKDQTIDAVLGELNKAKSGVSDSGNSDTGTTKTTAELLSDVGDAVAAVQSGINSADYTGDVKKAVDEWLSTYSTPDTNDDDKITGAGTTATDIGNASTTYGTLGSGDRTKVETIVQGLDLTDVQNAVDAYNTSAAADATKKAEEAAAAEAAKTADEKYQDVLDAAAAVVTAAKAETGYQSSADAKLSELFDASSGTGVTKGTDGKVTAASTVEIGTAASDGMGATQAATTQANAADETKALGKAIKKYTDEVAAYNAKVDAENAPKDDTDKVTEDTPPEPGSGGGIAGGKISSSNAYIGTSTAKDTVNTADGTNGITVTSATRGIKGQIAGLSFSITDSDGNVKKSANAALDAFKTTIYAANTSEPNELTFQIGAAANQAIAVSLDDMRAEALGLKGSDGTKVSVATQDKANAAVAVFDNAIAKALDQQTTIGAVESRLEYTSSNLTTMSENVQSAESTIRDADMAKEMTAYTKNNVLLQAAQSMLAQANQSSSQVLSLLQ